MSNENPNLKTAETKYAHIVSSTISGFDATLIFYQVKPMRIEEGNFKDLKNTIEEVSRVTLPHQTLKELHDLLQKQMKEVEKKAGEGLTIEKLNKNKG